MFPNQENSSLEGREHIAVGRVVSCHHKLYKLVLSIKRKKKYSYSV